MPSLFTHHLIAEFVYDKLDSSIQHKITKPAVYALGAQGADLFFFYKLHAGKKNNLGGRLHKLNIYQTFSALQRQLWRLQNKYNDYIHSMQNQEERQTTALMQDATHTMQEIQTFSSYIAGYITHYVADTVFHPFIYAMEEKFLKLQPKWRGKRHAYIENDVDSYLLTKYRNIKASEYNLSFTIKQEDMPSLCSSLRVLCYEAGYPNFTMQELVQIIKRMNLYARLTRDSTRHRRFLLNSLENLLFLPHVFSVAMHRDVPDEDCVNSNHEVWINPSCGEKESTESAADLFERAVADSVTVLSTFFTCVAENKPLPKEVFNKHFLSGLDENLPHVIPNKKNRE